MSETLAFAPSPELTFEPTTDFTGPELFETEQPKPEGFLAHARNIGHNVLSSVSETFSNVADRLSTRVVVGGVAIAAAMAPGIAEANITVDKGIGPVTLRQTKAQVYRELGRPDRIYGPSINPYLKGQAAEWDYHLKGAPATSVADAYIVQFNPSGKVSDIDTANPRQKTDRGVGPGSTIATVKHAYPRINWIKNQYGTVAATKSRQPNGDVVQTVFNFVNRNRAVDVSISDPSIDHTLRYVTR